MLVVLPAQKYPPHYYSHFWQKSNYSKRNGKLAWVLSPGFLRGWFQYGVMDVLNNMGLQPDLVVGCSIGALTGMAPATRTPIEIIEVLQERYDLKHVTSKTPYNIGLYSNDDAMALLSEAYPNYQHLGELPVPLIPVVTDRKTMKPVALTHGDIYKAVQASCSIPLVFPPVEIDGNEYVDGGVSNPCPIDVAKRFGADHVIFIDTYSGGSPDSAVALQEVNRFLKMLLSVIPNRDIPTLGNMYPILKGITLLRPALKEAPRMILAMQNQIIEKSLQLNPVDVHINVSHVLGPDVGIPIHKDSFTKGRYFIDKGREAAEHYTSQLEELKKKLYSPILTQQS